MIVASSLYAMPLYVFTLLAIVSNESRKKRIASASVKKSRCRLAVGDHSTYWSIQPTGYQLSASAHMIFNPRARA